MTVNYWRGAARNAAHPRELPTMTVTSAVDTAEARLEDTQTLVSAGRTLFTR